MFVCARASVYVMLCHRVWVIVYVFVSLWGFARPFVLYRFVFVYVKASVSGFIMFSKMSSLIYI